MCKQSGLVLVLALGVSACTPANDHGTVARLLRSQLEQIEQITTPDIELYLSHFSDNAVLLPPNGPEVVGKQAALEFYKSAFHGAESLRIEYSDPIIEVSGRLAVRRYSGTADIRFDSSREEIRVATKYLDVLKKQPDGSWKIIVHAWGANE